MRTFHLLCQCYFYVNGPFFQCLLPLIYFYIDSRDCWDCFLSVIAPIHPYMTPPPPSVYESFPPVLPSYQFFCPLSCLYVSLSVNDPFYKLSCLLVESNIDSWDCWDCDIWDCWYCVLSFLATIRPVDASFLSIQSIRPSVCCPTDVSLPPYFPSTD